jgi:hypothetical protein
MQLKRRWLIAWEKQSPIVSQQQIESDCHAGVRSGALPLSDLRHYLETTRTDPWNGRWQAGIYAATPIESLTSVLIHLNIPERRNSWAGGRRYSRTIGTIAKTSGYLPGDCQHLLV